MAANKVVSVLVCMLTLGGCAMELPGQEASDKASSGLSWPSLAGFGSADAFQIEIRSRTFEAEDIDNIWDENAEAWASPHCALRKGGSMTVVGTPARGSSTDYWVRYGQAGTWDLRLTGERECPDQALVQVEARNFDDNLARALLVTGPPVASSSDTANGELLSSGDGAIYAPPSEAWAVFDNVVGPLETGRFCFLSGAELRVLGFSSNTEGVRTRAMAELVRESDRDLSAAEDLERCTSGTFWIESRYLTKTDELEQR